MTTLKAETSKDGRSVRITASNTEAVWYVVPSAAHGIKLVSGEVFDALEHASYGER